MIERAFSIGNGPCVVNEVEQSVRAATIYDVRAEHLAAIDASSITGFLNTVDRDGDRFDDAPFSIDNSGEVYYGSLLAPAYRKLAQQFEEKIQQMQINENTINLNEWENLFK